MDECVVGVLPIRRSSHGVGFQFLSGSFVISAGTGVAWFLRGRPVDRVGPRGQAIVCGVCGPLMSPAEWL